MKIFKPKFWSTNHISFLSIILLPISIIIQLLLTFKKFFSKQVEFNIPVFCVGNIYLGGTGKTPISIKISQILVKQNKKTAIVKKFYKNQFDEVQLVKNNFKNIFIDISRIGAIHKAIDKNFNAVVLDDGFQDYSIKKTLNILCFNQRQLIGNGLTIPSGPLRENLNSIRNCQIIVINGNREKKFEDKIKRISQKIKVFYCNYIPFNIPKIKNKRLLAFAGIGNPENFFDLLKKNNYKVKEKISFPDHYVYSKKDIKELTDMAKKNRLKLITTEKDYHRLKKFGYEKNIFYLPIKVKFDKEKQFIKELKKYL